MGELLTPAFTIHSLDASTTVRNDTAVTDAPPSCPGAQAEALPGVNALKLSCGTASAKLADTSGGESHALGGEALIEPSLANLLKTIQLSATGGSLLTVESNHFCVLKSRGAILNVYETGQYPVETPDKPLLGFDLLPLMDEDGDVVEVPESGRLVDPEEPIHL